ncbi:MAG: DUF1822 family protein, partial [Cyanobacteria bacterium J06632_3]
LDEIHVLQQQASESSAVGTFVSQAQARLTQLSTWVDGAISASWQAVDTLVNPAEFGFAFRGAELANRSDRISRAKLIDLGIQLGQSIRVALVVHLIEAENNNTDIILQVRPLGDSPYLMEDLHLRVLDEQDSVISSVASRAIDNYIQLRISGESGEQFAIELAAGDRTFREQFII